MKIAPVYPILDVEAAARHGHDLAACAAEFARLGLDVQQLRAKRLDGLAFLRLAEQLMRFVPRLIVNDRADVALLAGAAGVHVGQHDLPVTAARRLNPGWMIGYSTHAVEQAVAAEIGSPGYLAIGPVYATASKEKPDPVVGVETVAAVRRQSQGMLVAIGGIQIENCAAVWSAGADAVAVISALWNTPAGKGPAEAAEKLLQVHSRLASKSRSSCAGERILP